MTRMTKQEKEWQAESDAHTLITAEAILADSVRKKLALQKVMSIAKEKENEAKAAKKVANKKRTAKTRKTNKRTRRKK